MTQMILVPGIRIGSKYFRVEGLAGVYRLEDITIGKKRMKTFKIYRKVDGVETYEDCLMHTTAARCLMSYIALSRPKIHAALSMAAEFMPPCQEGF